MSLPALERMRKWARLSLVYSSMTILSFPSLRGTVKLVTPSRLLNVIANRLPPILKFENLTLLSHAGKVGLLTNNILLGASAVSPRVDWRIMKMAPAAHA